ncbi:MAG: hypothetical protein ABFC67_09040 [Mizugakiibacter sp.]|uniref:hypothetical protein n=1 Tax=Mizugakiibacter sp. TaxID=1972610 RepID=UPI0031C854BF|nr:hypothetical protein [Xanthomonadaceae bacterium]
MLRSLRSPVPGMTTTARACLPLAPRAACFAFAAESRTVQPTGDRAWPQVGAEEPGAPRG